MATGLGMSDAEWEDLKDKVDDSFWVMRIIGLSTALSYPQNFSLGDQGIHLSLTMMMDFLVALTS
jgi:hypothetical protein